MTWQLWVLIAAAATGLTLVLTVKLRHAQLVFDRIVSQPGDTRTDELSIRRRRRTRRPEPARQLLSHPGLASHGRRHR